MSVVDDRVDLNQPREINDSYIHYGKAAGHQ